MRITRKVFTDLAIWQIGFGLAIGLLFPLFVIALGVPRETALAPQFFAACLLAGCVAGAINQFISHRVVGARLRLLVHRMTHVEELLERVTFSGDVTQCTPEACMITVDSEDEIGDSAEAFNRLVDALAESLRTQAAVRSFSDTLTSHLEIDGLAHDALGQFCEHTSAAAGLILCTSEGELRIAASRGVRDPETIVASDYVMLAVRSGEPQAISIPDDVRVEGVVTDFRPTEIVVLPIQYKGVSLGATVLATGRSFGREDRGLMDLYTQGLGLALNNARAHDRLQRLAAVDPLTGVYNRRFGLGRLKEEFGRAVRSQAPLGVLMMDLDHFKSVNDTYGHLVGDRLLKSVCAVVRSSLRQGDVLMRYGGEEFVAVLPAASAADLDRLGERLRRAVEESAFKDGARTVRMTLSVGGVAYPDCDVESEDAMIRLADEALYRAKEAGRNRIEIVRDTALSAGRGTPSR